MSSKLLFKDGKILKQILSNLITKLGGGKVAKMSKKVIGIHKSENSSILRIRWYFFSTTMLRVIAFKFKMNNFPDFLILYYALWQLIA